MSELRVPDPTLTALPRGFVVEFISFDSPGTPAEAHLIDSQHAWGPIIAAEDARWFAVPCRKCFPDAPEPGYPRDCWPDCDCADDPDVYLDWQIPVDNAAV